MRGIPEKQSKGAVFRAVCGAWYLALIGYASRRKRLLGRLEVRQRKFAFGGREITALESGATAQGRPVIFLHGAAGNAVDWGWFLKNSYDRFPVIAIDRPGYGPAAIRCPDIAQDLEALREMVAVYARQEKNPDGKVVLVGHSVGGGYAAWLAAECPDLVAGLVLVSPTLDPDMVRQVPIQATFARPVLSWLLPRTLRHGNEELRQYKAFLAQLEPQLCRICCPVTVLHARNDGLVPFDDAKFIKNTCTRAAALNTMIVETGGHFLNRTKPHLVLEVLENL